MIITKKSLNELNNGEIKYQYALSPRGNEILNYATGKTYGEAFDELLDLFEEMGGSYEGICEIRESDENKDRGFVTLSGRTLSEIKQ